MNYSSRTNKKPNLDSYASGYVLEQFKDKKNQPRQTVFPEDI